MKTLKYFTEVDIGEKYFFSIVCLLSTLCDWLLFLVLPVHALLLELKFNCSKIQMAFWINRETK